MGKLIIAVGDIIKVAEMVIQLLNEFCNQNNNVTIIFNLYDEETKSIYEYYI